VRFSYWTLQLFAELKICAWSKLGELSCAAQIFKLRNFKPLRAIAQFSGKSLCDLHFETVQLPVYGKSTRPVSGWNSGLLPADYECCINGRNFMQII
jgi:hypothetical protein